MAVRNIKNQNITWHYITDFSNSDLNFLKENFKFHPLDLKDCAGELQRSKIDTYKNYFFLILQLPNFDQNSKRISISQLYIFIGKNYLVTITKGKIKPLNNLFYKINNSQKTKDEVFSQSTGYLLYKILDAILPQKWRILSFLDHEVKKIESDIDEGRGKRVVFEIAALRRLILQIKSILDPQRLTINALSRLNVASIL